MNLYLDDDSADGVLVKMLRAAGHDVVVPADIDYAGRDDPEHMGQAIAGDRVLLTKNYDDFSKLHDLIDVCGGHHPGILVVRQDNDKTRDMTQRAIVVAIANLIAHGTPLPDSYHYLNHYR